MPRKHQFKRKIFQKVKGCFFLVASEPHLSTPSKFKGMPLELKEKKINAHNRFRIPNEETADWLVVYNLERAAETGPTEQHLQLRNDLNGT